MVDEELIISQLEVLLRDTVAWIQSSGNSRPIREAEEVREK